MFKTIDDFKRAAEFFPAGRIIPQRILKGPRKYKHRITFGSDSWAVNTPGGYVIAINTGETGSGIRIKPGLPEPSVYVPWKKKLRRKARPKGINLYGSPYTKGGGTHWVGNTGRAEEKWLEAINRVMAGARPNLFPSRLGFSN